MTFKKTVLFLMSISSIMSISAQYSNAAAEKQGWKLAAQAWTFNKFTFLQAIDKMKTAGINNIEMFPSQTIGEGFEGKTTFQMPKKTQKKLLEIIQSKGMSLVNYGVVNVQTKAEWIQIFDFAKDMGIKTIITEADSLQLNYIDPLCEKYQIKIALHNHPAPPLYKNKSIYWNPEYTMNQLVNRSKWIGACTDLGHWLRSGLDPLESLKKYEGRVLTVHAKDLVPSIDGSCGFHDVPWGTGVSNFSGLMHELKRQGFKGVISVEYEYHWENSFEEVKESADYFNRLTTWMSKE